jgi:hypothetical protein
LANAQGYYFQRSFGRKGFLTGQFNSPLGAAVDKQGNLYVVDEGNNRVQKFDSIGNFITQWYGSGNGGEEFNQPWDITINKNNQIYVLENGTSRVQKFDTDGHFLKGWTFNTTSGYGIDTDTSGNVYVLSNSYDANSGGHVLKFDTSGILIKSWTVGNAPGYLYSLLVTANGKAYVNHGYDGNTYVYDLDGNFISNWNLMGSGSITKDGEGNIYFAGLLSSTINKFSKDETFLLTITRPSTHGNEYPGDIAVGKGLIYVTNQTSQVVEIYSPHPPITTGINAHEDDRQKGFFPNPSADGILKTNNLNVSAKVVDTSGQVVYAGKPNNGTLNLSFLLPGCYILEYTDNDQPCRQKLLIK